MAVVSDEARIRELAEAIRSKCAQAQQMKQQTSSTTVSTLATGNMQLEVRRRLKEVIVRLQEDVRDTSMSGIQQRLQYTAQKFSLSFSIQRPPGLPTSCYISCESFFVEVCLDDNGYIVSTKLVLGQEPQNSEVLTSLLRKQDYATFETHIHSLVDMFNQYNGQEKAKVLLQVMKAIEQILHSIHNNSTSRNPLDTILLNHLGYVAQRQAGIPMCLTFYITPSESLKHPQLKSNTNNESLISSVGVAAKVLVERSTQLYKLPTDPNLFNSSQASFHHISDQNSIKLPLTLVLSLTKDIPICATVMQKLQQTVYGADQSMPVLTTPHVNQLILLGNKENGSNTNTHVIYLEGQVHTYNGINGIPEVDPAHRGVLLPNRKVPFTHPIQVISIIHLLRQQLVYNTLFQSCLQRNRHSSKSLLLFDDYEFHVTTRPPEMVAVTTDLLNIKGGTTSLKFEFMVPQELRSPPTQPKLNIKIGDATQSDIPLLNTILAKCLSIPVTLHTILSRPSILPISLAAVINEHNRSLKEFRNQLMSSEMSCDQRKGGVALENRSSTSTFAGTKRKRN